MRLAKKDANHDEILWALQATSVAVEDTHRVGSGIPDVFVLFAADNTIHLIEIKVPGGKLTAREREFHDKFAGARNLHIVESIEDALGIAVTLAKLG